MIKNRSKVEELRELGWTAEDIRGLLKELKEGTGEAPKIEAEEVRQKITRILMEHGFRFNIRGTAYTREAIIYMLENGTDVSITKELYPAIAKSFRTTSSKVERAIRHAIETAFEEGSPALVELFGYTLNPNTGKLSNSEYIARISDLIKQGLL